MNSVVYPGRGGGGGGGGGRVLGHPSQDLEPPFLKITGEALAFMTLILTMEAQWQQAYGVGGPVVPWTRQREGTACTMTME